MRIIIVIRKAVESDRASFPSLHVDEVGTAWLWLLRFADERGVDFATRAGGIRATREAAYAAVMAQVERLCDGGPRR